MPVLRHCNRRSRSKSLSSFPFGCGRCPSLRCAIAHLPLHSGASGPCAMVRLRTANVVGRFSPGGGFRRQVPGGRETTLGGCVGSIGKRRPTPDAKTDGSLAMQREADARNDPVDRRREYSKARDLQAKRLLSNIGTVRPTWRKRSAVGRASPAARDCLCTAALHAASFANAATSSETLTPPRAPNSRGLPQPA